MEPPCYVSNISSASFLCSHIFPLVSAFFGVLHLSTALQAVSTEVFEGASADSDSNATEQAHPDRGTANDHMAKMAELARLEREAAADDMHSFIINTLYHALFRLLHTLFATVFARFISFSDLNEPLTTPIAVSLARIVCINSLSCCSPIVVRSLSFITCMSVCFE
ncbi:hypothetical protein GGX14DRAFT_580979 [Mycena pura]|uniref:Transmembrane protein n=1 Tax=Mycena pura TaxID=153505 RepID=A0AAD6XYU5_9AGAR|nr:hypothetical protein GGX14DRAFT_580979 [Mycena pura]